MSNGIGKNPLNDITKVYLEAVAAKPDYLDLDKDGNKKEPMKKAAKEVEAPKEKLKTDRDMFNIPKGEQQAAKERLLAKARAKRAKMAEALDPVGQEDADIDNDGDTDKSDKYLHKRRKAISKAIAGKKSVKEGKHQPSKVHGVHEVPSGDLKGLVAKAVKRVDQDVDGDVDKNDPKAGPYGEYVPSPDGKKRVYTKVARESYSNWRTDLVEVMDEIEGDKEDKQIKEKKVQNKIVINPEMKESIEEIGGTLLEMVEVDEFDYVVENVYEELLDEGYSEDEVEFAIETALTTLDEGYYDSAVATSKAKSKVSMKDRLKSAAKKVITRGAYAAGKVAKARETAAAAPGRAKRKVASIADRVKGAARSGYAAGRGPVEKKTSYRGAGVGRKERIGEDVEQVDEKYKGSGHRPPAGWKPYGGDEKGPVPEVDATANRIEAIRKSIKTKTKKEEVELVDEKLDLKKADMGDVVKDFYKSDAPQFKGRSKEKRRQMAIAAKLTAERGGRKLGEAATEMPMSPQELTLQKKKTQLDVAIAKRRQQALQKSKGEG